MHHTASDALHARAQRIIPGGVNSARRRTTPTICFAEANGSRLVDHDGNTYVDCHGAWGAILLGHSFPAVNDAVRSTMEHSVMIGAGVTELEVELAETLVRLVPCAEAVLLCNTGNEATFHTIRLARAVTGRQKIIKFQGNFHGSHDYVLRNNLSAPDRIGRRDPGSAGMLEPAIDATLVCRFNDAEDVRATLAEHYGEVAAVIIEPISHNSPGILPREGFLQDVRALCDAQDTLLIFDEVITGFRHHIGGYQAICKVTPDLAAFAKSLGNGFPIAAIAGKRDYMERFNTRVTGDVHFGGTFNGGSVGVSAALATLSILESTPAHEHLYRLGERTRTGLDDLAERVGFPARATGFGSVFWFAPIDGPLDSYDDVPRIDTELAASFQRGLVERGIFVVPDGISRGCLSVSHTDEDIDRVLEAAEGAMADGIGAKLN